MKNNTLSQWIGAGVLATSLAILPSVLPATAQTNSDPAGTTAPGATSSDPIDTTSPSATSADPMDTTSPGTSSTNTAAPYDTTNTTTADDNGTDWGWLGLLGLLGLGGLAGRKRHEEPSAYRTSDRVTTSSTSDPRF